jgi:hypothetical protein
VLVIDIVLMAQGLIDQSERDANLRGILKVIKHGGTTALTTLGSP